MYQDGNDDGSDDMDVEEEDDDDIKAKIAAYAESLRKEAAKKQPATHNKPKKKGELRADIEVESGGKGRTSIPPRMVPSAKKPKAAVGGPGLKANWQKELGLPKAVKKSTTDWCRSISRASPFTLVTSHSNPTAPTSGDEDGARMGIILKKITIDLDVNGKAKKQPKPRYNNSDLPSPVDDHAKDVKHFQNAAVPISLTGRPSPSPKCSIVEPSRAARGIAPYSCADYRRRSGNTPPSHFVHRGKNENENQM
ncbi:hypothetical protein K438DRAFT_1995825 [Mycena galopus ATCC 62051]|nr:hypothetical protein K438DRAFT_1995825 [Mycena galopus ATCC 62051]